MAIIQQIKLKETNWGDEANSLNTNFEQLNLNKAEVGQEITPELGGSEIPSAELKTYTYTNPQGIEETYTFRVGQTAIFQDDRGRSLYAFKGLEGDNAIWERVNDNGDSETTKKLFTAINLALAGEVTGTVKTDLSKNVSINTTVQPMDASKIISGVFDLDRIPKGAIERLAVVPNKTARFALTPEEVQNGDTVKEIDTKLMYYVVDNTKLSTEEGYEVYQAGRAAACPWTGIENKPTTIAGYGITDAYTKDEVQDLVNDFYPMTGGDLYGEITQLLPYNSDGSNPPNLVNFEYRAGASRNAAGCVGIIGDYMVLQAGLGIDTSGPAIWINRNNGSIWIKENGNPDLIKIWNETNDGPNSGLDADTVDGKHINNLMLYNSSVKANEYPLNEMGYGQAVNGWKFYGPCASFGTSAGDKKYVFQIQSALGGQVWARVTNDDGVTDWKEFAFLDANGKVAKAIIADSANKLATARTINGVAFDGTANITITAAANGGNSNTVEGKNLDSLFVTNKGSINLDSTGSSWSNTYSPDSEGTIPVPNTYGTILQVSNHPHTAPGNGGIYPFQIGFSTDNSISFRSRFDNTAWTAWRKFILEGDKWGSIEKAENGWYKNDSGLIVQWGILVLDTNGSKPFTINFPISFTSPNFKVIAHPVINTYDNNPDLVKRAVNYKLGFSSLNDSTSGINGYIECEVAYGSAVKWIAIGF